MPPYHIKTPFRKPSTCALARRLAPVVQGNVEMGSRRPEKAVNSIFPDDSEKHNWHVVQRPSWYKTTSPLAIVIRQSTNRLPGSLKIKLSFESKHESHLNVHPEIKENPTTTTQHLKLKERELNFYFCPGFSRIIRFISLIHQRLAHTHNVLRTASCVGTGTT